jgi:hypothetical protein
MSALYKRFIRKKSDKKAFERLRKLCGTQIMQWRYWETPDWYWDPDWNLDARQAPKRENKNDAIYHYGYDKQNRVVFIREAVLPGDEDDDCTFFFLRYSADTITGHQFLEKDLHSVFEATLSEGRVVQIEQGGFGEWDSKTISWRDRHVLKVTTSNQYEPGNKVVIETTYDKSGKVIAEIDRSKIKEKPLPKDVTLKSLEKEIRKSLVQAVVKTVVKLRIKKPVYCLALNYDCEGNPIMPPMLGVGLDSERQARLKKGGKDAKLDIWEPEQFSNFAKENTEFSDKKLERACDWYNRLLEKKGTNAPAHKLLNEVATELGNMDWTGKLNITDDFVAYAVDTDGADLQKNLKQSVPTERLKKLKAAKLI